MGGSIAVTGASGFVGQQLVGSLLASGADVRALVRRPGSTPRSSSLCVVTGSLEDEASLDLLLKGADAVVHCAGLTKAPDARTFHRVNAAGTARLADACERREIPPRVLLVSSLAARCPELSDYAASKRRGEDELAERAKRSHWTILRPPAVYGPGDRQTLRLFRLLRHGVLPMPRAAATRLSLIYVADLCRAIVAALGAPIQSGRTFEVRDACAEGYTWRGIADVASRSLRRRVTCLPLPRWAMRPFAATNELLGRVTGFAPMLTPGKLREIFHEDWLCRSNPLAECTDWRPGVTFDQGFGLTMKWYRDNEWL